MISDSDLSAWTRALGLDSQIFEAWAWECTKQVLAPFDPMDVSSLSAADPERERRLQQAIELRIAGEEWPSSLERGDYVHLFYRAVNANALLTAAATMDEAVPGIINYTRFPPPDPQNRGEFIRWLYVDLWNAGKDDLLSQMAERVRRNAPARG